jgi:hypothetical protein
MPNRLYDGTQRVIYSFWTGTNEMSPQRRDCLEALQSLEGITHILVGPETLNEYILQDHPLHEAYQYLSETHKADYLRTYFMHHYGGGYSDIKKPNETQLCTWLKAFQDMQDSPKKLLNGCREKGPYDVAGSKAIQLAYKELPNNNVYIVRPQTDFTTMWYTDMLALLDKKLDRLKKYPAQGPQDCNEICADRQKGYPVGWTEMLGHIYHKVAYTFRGNFLFTVPECILVNYR